MSVELLKIIVQPVVLERDENGVVVGEELLERIAIYSQEQLDDLVMTIRERITEINKNGGSADASG